MFTQCTQCDTIFRLSAHVLRAAGGQVRCGRCGEVFNAVSRLAEDAGNFKQGESPLELATRVDRILHTVEPVAPAGLTLPPEADESPFAEIARLMVQEDPSPSETHSPTPAPAPAAAPTSDTLLEYSLAPGDLDRVFVETSPAALQLLNPEAYRRPATPAPTPARAAPTPLAAPSPPPVTPLAPVAPVAPVAPLAPLAPLAPPASPPPPTWSAPPNWSAPPEAPPPHPESLARAAPLEVEAELPADLLPFIESPRRGLPRGAWLAAAILLSVLLATQWVMTTVQGAAGGLPNLTAYQLRQWGVTGDPDAAGALRVRASILNTGARMQPYPLLRVTLANRFGTRIGERDFEPFEYVGKPVAKQLAPGEQAEATLDIMDPGKDAEGFEIDLCVRGHDQKLACAGDLVAGGGKTAATR